MPPLYCWLYFSAKKRTSPPLFFQSFFNHFPLRSRHCRHGLCAGLLLFCLFVSPAFGHPDLILNINGELTDAERNNISSYLSLNRIEDSKQLSTNVFKRLYRKAEREATKALEPFGYYAPTINLSKKELEGGKWQVDLEVQPGEPIRIQNIAITYHGPGANDDKLLKAIDLFPLQKGDALNHPLYAQGKQQLISKALESGYPKASFGTSRVEVQKKNLSAAITIDIETGPLYLIGKLEFQADFMNHELLQKITPIQEGAPFSPKALTRMRQSLYNAGYFSQVDISYDLDRAEPVTNKVPITIALTQNLAHKYGIGLGYGTDTGPRGTLEYTNRYLNHYGHQLDLQFQPSQIKTNFGGTYSIPIGDPKKDTFSLSGLYETESYENTETETINATISRDYYRGWGELSYSLQYLHENYDTGSIIDSDRSSFFIPGVKTTLFWANDRISTDRGLRISAKIIGSEKSALGDADFLQATFNAKGIYRFWEDWRFIGRAEIGTTLVDDIYSIPPSLRFYAGGDQSVRGYAYKEISPTDDKGNLLGGKDMLTYSLELERRLYKAWSGAVFYDSGTTMNSFTDCTMHSGAGVGLRWSGIFGQVRLDLAKALDKSGSWRIHFTLGADL